MSVVVVNRNPSTATSTNVVVENAVYTPDPGTPGTVGVAVRAERNLDGSTTFYAVGSALTDKPQSFYGFLTRGGGTGVIIATGRGSLVNPIVEGDIPLVPDVDVYLSAVPGRVTQNPITNDGHAQLRVGVALSATQMIIATDSRINF